MELDRLRLEYAAEGFLSAMRRIHAGRANKSDVEIGNLADYSPEDRAALMGAISHAIKRTAPASDSAYQTWLINKQAQTAN